MPEDIEPAPDTAALGRWLDENDAPGAGEQPVLELLTGGSQNTLYRVRRGDERMVLRTPGSGADATRLDGLLREIRLVRGLKGTDVPHAELIAADESGEILGKPFYVMAEIDGWSPMGGGWQAPFDTDLDARRDLAFELVEGAAKLGARRLAGPGPGGVRPPGRLPRASGGPLAELPAGLPGPGTSRPRRGRRLAAPQPARALHRPASCTATTSSPTSCTRTALRPGWPRSWTGR